MQLEGFVFMGITDLALVLEKFSELVGRSPVPDLAGVEPNILIPVIFITGISDIGGI